QLVWKRKLEIIKENNKYFLLKGKDISSADKLPSYVEKIYPFILKQLKNNKIEIDKLKTKIQASIEFYNLFYAIKKEYDNWFKKENYLNKNGYTIFLVFVVLSLVLFVFNPISAVIVLFILIGFSIYSSVSRNSFVVIFGKWNKEGRILNLKWNNFQKYITDFSLMESHPPQSVAIWDFYLVYATSFGVAKKTCSILKKINPQLENDIQFAHTSYFATNLSSGFTYTGLTSGNGSIGSGGFGGSGGGFGGGGAGAR
ncbi:MAG: hypothetical protein V1824_04210, partial [archaeon]